MSLEGKTILITGAAVRVGRAMALAVAHAGADVMVHFGHSDEEAKNVQAEIEAMGRKAHLLQADLSQAEDSQKLIKKANEISPLFGLVNSASIFQDRTLADTNVHSWDLHMDINLRAPFLLSQAFATTLKDTDAEGRIVNIVDWRALRPGADHLPYTISKAGLVALTQSLAIAMAPQITVNAMAFGAILPPSDGGDTRDILEDVPAQRWADLDEVGKTLIFLLDGPSYITGEIVHLDGGRHLI